MAETFYVTTPLYYVNADPHIGHAYTTIAADAVARFQRFLGRKVLFVTGSDEHGQKLLQAAKEAGLPPQEFVDRMVEPFKALWRDLHITYDRFIRTTESTHEQNVQRTFRKLLEKGDIYKGVYEGWYCLPCETFWTEKQASDRKCPSCARPVRWIQEENYFFALSRYRDWLLEYVRQQEDFVLPEERRNELLRRLEGEVRDLCVSRHRLPWGVPVPGDPDYTIYVWFDALHGYLTAAGLGSDMEAFEVFWPTVTHLIGKDILWFHAAVWPAILKAAGYPLPRRVFAHGFWLSGGEKMSKSKGNVVDPRAVLQVVGADGLRYYLLRSVPFGEDGDITLQSVVERYNADLANDLGNLFHRVTSLLHRYFGGRVPEEAEPEHWAPAFHEKFQAAADQYRKAMERFRFHEALSALQELVRAGNHLLDAEKPWSQVQNAPARAAGVLAVLLDVLFRVSYLYEPFLPEKMPVLRSAVDRRLPEERWSGLVARLEWRGAQVKKVPPLYPRIQKVVPVEQKKEEKKEEREIGMEEFKRLQLVVARIVEARRVPRTDRLLELRVDLGGEERTIVAGIGDKYAPEALVGRQVIVVANLRPARIRGILSRGMLLAADSPEGPVLVLPDREVPPGTIVR